MSSQLVADVTLYTTIDGGKEWAAQPGWGCPCCREKSPMGDCFDGWPVLDEPLDPGSKRRLSFVFLSGDAVETLRKAGTFYLWEGQVVGEAVVVK